MGNAVCEMHGKEQYMKTITVWNRKGGVGKTTLSFNLASCLATEHQKKVLGIDLDEQMNFSLMLEKGTGRTKADIVKLAKDNFKDMKKAVYKGKNVDYIRGSHAKAYVQTINGLYEGLKSLRDYDYVIIDCPASFSHIVQSAIYAADFVLVPIGLDAFSKDNLNLVSTSIESVRQAKELNELVVDEEDFMVDIPWSIVVNRVANRKNQKETFTDLVYKHDYPMLDICISETTAVATANSMKKPVYQHRSHATVAQDIRDMVDLIREEVEEDA